MNIPLGFGDKTGNKVCRLKMALYGLKQSPRIWYSRFSKVMKKVGYKQNQGENTLFMKHSTIRGVYCYVDDIIISGNDKKEQKKKMKQQLINEFELK